MGSIEKQLKNSLNTSWAVSILSVTCFILLMHPNVALAADLGSVGETVGDNLKRGAAALKYLSFTGGLYYGISGLKGMYDAQRQQGQVTMGQAATKLGIGAGLAGIGGVIQTMSATMFGSDQASGLGELGF